MKYLILSSLLTLNIFAANNVKDAPFYGQEIKAKSAITLDKAVKNYSQYEGKNFVMEAMVDKVCAKKGCWMTLKDSKKAFRVKFQDYKFFVPMSLIGKKIWVDGKMQREEVSIADTKHYLEDAGASKEEIDAVKSVSYEYRFLARGVRVVR